MGSKPHEVDKDEQSALNITGRHQVVMSQPTKEFKRSTLAAGAVLYRGDATDPQSLEVAVIHRPHYDDYSLAKGKIDAGESLVTTAVREIKEETGYDVRLGKLLGRVNYPVGDRTKVVYYWTAEVLGGEFVPNKEVDSIEWMPLAQAKEKLSYDVDRSVLEKAQKRFHWPTTTRILYVRHGRAYRRQNWAGNDNLRPLDSKGRRQADYLVPLLKAFHPTSIHSAEPARCQQTVKPLSEALGLDIQVNPKLGDDAWIQNMKGAKATFKELVNTPGTHVVCSQGIAIPDMIAHLSTEGTLPLEEIPAKKASVWVLTFHEGQLTGADYLASPLPVK